MKGEEVKSRKITQQGQKRIYHLAPKALPRVLEALDPTLYAPAFSTLFPVTLPPGHVQPEEGLKERTSRVKSESVHMSSHIQGINILRPDNGADPPPTPAVVQSRYH